MKYNFGGFTGKANIALNFAITSAEKLGHTYVGSEHLLLSFLKTKDNKLKSLLEKENITYEVIKEEIIGNEANILLEFDNTSLMFSFFTILASY